MKSQRHKKIRSTYKFFSVNFEFREPQKILVDGNFLKNAVDIRYDVLYKLKAVLDIKVYMNITPCIIKELELIGEPFQKVLDAARKIRLYNCGHHNNCINATECIKSLVGDGNSRKFIVATQDSEVHELANTVIPLPILYFQNGNILKMLEVSKATRDEARRLELKKQRLVSTEYEEVKRMKAEDLERMKKIRKERMRREREKLGIKVEPKAKGPNPLSCKKKSVRIERPSHGAASN